MQSETNNMPLLSIISVCRNDAARLKITIDSLRAFYGDPRFEHVVVDGESTDETDALVASLLQEANFKFYSARDSGIYDAMNRGVMYAKSPLLLFLNCGDTMTASPDELSAYLQPLTADFAIDLDIACFPVRQTGESGGKTLVPRHFSLHKMPISHQGMVFAKRFILLNKYQTSYKIAGDYDIYLRARRVEIIASKGSQPLVEVEADGFASSNPMLAYREYLSIAAHRLRGGTKLMVMVRIGIRALFVITVKTVFPSRWVAALRGV